ncbi:hypothetical protein BH10BAC2_BH10BAC2_06920 [soil metagenome]
MQQINVEELRALQKDNHQLLLVDVREPEEHAAYNIGGILIPVAEIIRQYALIPRNIPVIIYCRKGIRSQMAIQRLEDKFGFNNLVNLRCGIGDGPA